MGSNSPPVVSPVCTLSSSSQGRESGMADTNPYETNLPQCSDLKRQNNQSRYRHAIKRVEDNLALALAAPEDRSMPGQRDEQLDRAMRMERRPLADSAPTPP